MKTVEIGGGCSGGNVNSYTNCGHRELFAMRKVSHAQLDLS
jgi:hypothetical protein